MCFPVNIVIFLRTAFNRTPLHCIVPKFYVIIDIRCFRVIFYYCKIRPSNRKNFTIDQLKILMKRWVFSQLRFQFSFKDFFFAI